MPSILFFASSKRFILLCIIASLVGCKSDPAGTVIKDDMETVMPQKTIKKSTPPKVISSPASSENPSASGTKENAVPSEKIEESLKPKVKATEAKVNKEVVTSQPAETPKKSPKKIIRKPNIKFEQIRYDFGKITQGDTVDYKFKFSNEGKAPLVITNAKATCGCTQPSFPFMPIEPGETGYIGVKYVSVGKEGAQKPLITVTTNASKEPIALMLNGIVNLPENEKDKEKVAMVVDTLSQKIDTLK